MKIIIYITVALLYFLPSSAIFAAQEEELTFEGKLSVQIIRDVSIPFPIQVEKVFVQMGENVKKGAELLEYTLDVKDLRPLQHEISVAGGADDYALQDIDQSLNRLTRNSQHSLDAELYSKGMLSSRKNAQNSQEAGLQKKRTEILNHKKQVSQEHFAQRLLELEQYFGFPVKAGMKLPDKFYLTAPRGGTIIGMSSHARPGGYLSGNIFTIGQLNPIQALIEVHESEINNIHVGQPVTVNLVNDSAQKFSGKIIMRSWQPINAAIAVPSYYHVWVDVDNPDYILKPGYKVIIHIQTAKS